MITKVRLKNWRSHLESEFSFSNGTNALLGILGSGKTSVLDSICFGLFGTTPNLQAKKLKLDDIIMSKPMEKNSAEVEIFFKVDGKSFSVQRIIDKGKGTSYSEFRENGSLIEAPNSQRVTELVEKTLKTNYELFSKAIYSEQNALDYFLTIPKGQRMKNIDELLMIDKFEKARSCSVTLANRLAERKIGKQSIIDQIDVEKLEAEISDMRDAADQILEEKGQLSKSLLETSSEKKRLEKGVSELEKIKDSLELLRREESGISSAIDETVKVISSFEKMMKEKREEDVEKNLAELKKKVDEYENVLNDRRKRHEEINSSISESRAKIEFLKREKIEKLEKEIGEKLKIKKEYEKLRNIYGDDVGKNIEEKRNTYEKFVGEVQELRSKIKDVDEIIHQLSSLEGRCPICESELTEDKKGMLIKQKQQQVRDLKERLEEASKRKELNEKELEKLQDAAKKLDEMIIEIKDFDSLDEDFENSKKLFLELSRNIIETENQLSQIKKEMGGLEILLKEATEKRQQLEIFLMKQKDFEERKKRLDELTKNVKELEVKIGDNENKIAGRDLQEMDKRLKELIASEREIETKISSFGQLSDEKSKRIKEYEDKLNGAVRQKEDVLRLEKLIKDLRIFEKSLEQTQIELRTEFVQAVNYTMERVWPALYPYQDFIGVRLSIEEGDYVLQLREKSGRMANADGVASGGERSLACLALRIAFSLVLAPHMRMLILDEPTANLDSKSVAELAATLRGRINEFIDQTFLITHQAELEDAVTGNAYRIERDKEKDGTTKIVPIF